MGKERVKNCLDGTNPIPASWEQLGLSELSPGNSCYFIRTNRQQNFDFLIGGVINLPLKLERTAKFTYTSRILNYGPHKMLSLGMSYLFLDRGGRDWMNHFF